MGKRRNKRKNRSKTEDILVSVAFFSFIIAAIIFITKAFVIDRKNAIDVVSMTLTVGSISFAAAIELQKSRNSRTAKILAVIGTMSFLIAALASIFIWLGAEISFLIVSSETLIIIGGS